MKMVIDLSRMMALLIRIFMSGITILDAKFHTIVPDIIVIHGITVKSSAFSKQVRILYER